MKRVFNYIGMIIFIGLCFFMTSCEFPEMGQASGFDKAIITLREESIVLNLGETHKIDLNVMNAKATFTYDIEDESIISVKDGIIVALKEGKTNVTITVSCDDKEKTVKEFVISVEVKEVLCTITYQSNIDEYTKASETVQKGSTKYLNEIPIRSGYRFVGWRLSEDGSNITSFVVNGDTTVYAIFALKEYTITFNLDGGTYTGTNKVKHGEVLTLGTPTKDGFTFLGWSLTKGSTSYITQITGSKNMTIYANFEENHTYPEGVYPIKYNLDGGHWVATYYTPSEIAAEFMADFNASSGKNYAPSQLDCAYIESSWFADMMNKQVYRNKWLWLLNAIWEVAGGTDSQKPATADFSSSDVKGLYIGNLNGFFTSTAHKDSYLGPMSANYADPDISRLVCEKGTPKSEDIGPETYTFGTGLASIPSPQKSQYYFVRWVDSNGNTVTSISSTQTGAINLTAIWEHETIAEEVTFTNLPADGIKLYDTLQLTWVVTPNDAVNKKVLFYVMDDAILSITEDGLVKAKSVGTGRIRVKLESNPNYEQIINISTWSGNYFDVSYETTSYVEIGQTIKLLAAYVDKNQNRNNVLWQSLSEETAIVDDEGNVTAIAEGLATIRAIYNDLTFDFYVTVIGEGLSEVMQYVLDNHISNAKTTYNLGIGDGNPEYYYDVVSGVSNLLFDDLKYDYRYYDKLPSGTKNYGTMSSVEFITVHYTGNMRYGADADNNCSYFNDLDYRASIHYVTGRSNLTDLTGQSSGYSADAYYAFAGLNEKYGGWHATNGDPCVWDDTGLNVLAGDPETPVISISSNLKYTINGRETNISIPEAPSGYTINGSVLTVSGKQYSVFNQYGLRTKVVNGRYYLARTHWGTQRSPRALCTCGGNKNSIGIESCVDIGSDLEHTWHVTAQLVAELLVKYNLGLDRVVGHHFFSGKDCPQPLLENNMDLWNDFMDMVKAEYERLTKYQDVSITAHAVKSDNILKHNGLLVQDADAHCVTYEVSVTINNVTQKITLATCVESYFKCNCTRTQESLQIQGYPII